MNPTHLTVDQALRLTADETQLPLGELRSLLRAVTGLSATALISQGSEPLPMGQLGQFKALAVRRQKGEPMAYLLGEREFYSRPFKVDPHVLIPRHETEELIDHALAFLELRARENLLTRVLDLGTGSGCIAITLALENPILEVTASDVSPAALLVAQLNAQTLGAKNVSFIQADAFEGLLDQKPPLAFDLICSNPPYIAAGDPHLLQGDLRFEPALALTDLGDGLYFYRQIAQHAPSLLRPGGAVLVEHGYDQQAEVMRLFEAQGLNPVRGLRDLAGQPRFVMATVAPRP